MDILLILGGGLFAFAAIILLVKMTLQNNSQPASAPVAAAHSLADLSDGRPIVHAPAGATEISWLNQAGDIPVVVMFTADWCSYCQDLQPILEQSARQAEFEFLLVLVDIDDCPALARKYNVRTIPLVRAFVSGQEVNRFAGSADTARVNGFIANLPH